jgi:hypothetical protein
LVAFAKFGYRFILDRAFRPVREKIADPNSSLLPLFSIRIPGREQTGARSLVVIQEPKALANGLAVRMGQHLVLLPGPGDETFYDRVEGKQGAEVHLQGKEIPWPLGPEFFFDFGGTNLNELAKP